VTFCQAANQAGAGGKVTATVYQGEYVIVPGYPFEHFRWNPEPPENGRMFCPTPDILEYDWIVLEKGKPEDDKYARWAEKQKAGQ
jgi:hypothetical protein